MRRSGPHQVLTALIFRHPQAIVKERATHTVQKHPRSNVWLLQWIPSIWIILHTYAVHVVDLLSFRLLKSMQQYAPRSVTMVNVLCQTVAVVMMGLLGVAAEKVSALYMYEF